MLGNARSWLACTMLLAASAGCQSSDGLARIPVFGTVSLEADDPVNGMISFVPADGTVGPAATASVIDGVFAFDTKNGPVAGKYRVLVVSQVTDLDFKGAPAA